MTRTITRTTDPWEPPTLRELFQEFAVSLGLDFQLRGFNRELAELPGRDAPPWGCLFLATVDGRPADSVTLRPRDDGICEMKRLYVRPRHRGTGLGRALAVRVVTRGPIAWIDRLRLDTIPSIMRGVVVLYRELGFETIAPYCDNPIPTRCSWNCDSSDGLPSSCTHP